MHFLVVNGPFGSIIDDKNGCLASLLDSNGYEWGYKNVLYHKLSANQKARIGLFCTFGM